MICTWSFQFLFDSFLWHYSVRVFPCNISCTLLSLSSRVASRWLCPWPIFSLHFTWLLQDLAKSITSSSFILFIWLWGHLFFSSYWALFLSHIFWLSLFPPECPKTHTLGGFLQSHGVRYMIYANHVTYVFILAFTPKCLAHEPTCPVFLVDFQKSTYA